MRDSSEGLLVRLICHCTQNPNIEFGYVRLNIYLENLDITKDYEIGRQQLVRHLLRQPDPGSLLPQRLTTLILFLWPSCPTHYLQLWFLLTQEPAILLPRNEATMANHASYRGYRLESRQVGFSRNFLLGISYVICLVGGAKCKTFFDVACNWGGSIWRIPSFPTKEKWSRILKLHIFNIDGWFHRKDRPKCLRRERNFRVQAILKVLSSYA